MSAPNASAPLVGAEAQKLSAETAVAPEQQLPALFSNYTTKVTRRAIARNGSRAPINNNKRMLRRFANWLRGEGIEAEAVTEDDLYRYLDETHKAQSTKRLSATIICAAYRYAHRCGVLDADPFVEFEMPAEPIVNPGEKIIPADELRKQKGRCRTTKQVLLWAMAVYTGMRRDEIRRAVWEDVNWKDQTLTVLGKGKKYRIVPIHPVLLEVMTHINPAKVFDGAIISPEASMSHRAEGQTSYVGDPYGEDGTGLTFLLRKFSDSGFHHYRKTLATSLARNKVRPEVIDQIFGWSAPTVRAKYYVDVSLPDLHAGIAQAYADEAL
jgi:integrase